MTYQNLYDSSCCGVSLEGELQADDVILYKSAVGELGEINQTNSSPFLPRQTFPILRLNGDYTLIDKMSDAHKSAMPPSQTSRARLLVDLGTDFSKRRKICWNSWYSMRWAKQAHFDYSFFQMAANVVKHSNRLFWCIRFGYRMR